MDMASDRVQKKKQIIIFMLKDLLIMQQKNTLEYREMWTICN